MTLIQSSLEMLGCRAVDRVTGFVGVVSSIAYDAYGCVQALVTPPMENGKLNDPYWFDVKRLTIGARVVPAPNFDVELGAEPGGNILPVPR